MKYVASAVLPCRSSTTQKWRGGSVISVRVWRSNTPDYSSFPKLGAGKHKLRIVLKKPFFPVAGTLCLVIGPVHRQEKNVLNFIVSRAQFHWYVFYCYYYFVVAASKKIFRERKNVVTACLRGCAPMVLYYVQSSLGDERTKGNLVMVKKMIDNCRPSYLSAPSFRKQKEKNSFWQRSRAVR